MTVCVALSLLVYNNFSNLIVQWGFLNFSTTHGPVNVSLPITYTTNYSLMNTMYSTINNSTPTFEAVGYRTKTLSGFNTYISTGFSKSWFAIGY